MNKRLAIFGINLFLLFASLPFILSARQIDTFYGPIEVDEPVLLELIDSPAFQRLKFIHQYGVGYYTTHKEEYNRFDHSIGVFAILRANRASLEEQIAGLLHDVSHTAFSHVGDWIFSKENQEKDYQNEIHPEFLRKSGLADILAKYNITVEQVLPTNELFPALECPLPDLCADRIDYNIQGAYFQGFITYEEAVEIFRGLRFEQVIWVSRNIELMDKLTRSSLYLSETCWGSPTNYVTSRALADAILRAIELGVITFDDIHFGTDQEIWDKLIVHEDPIIKQQMHIVCHAQDYFTIVDSPEEADYVVKSKFRGINPWIEIENEFYWLTTLDKALRKEYEKVKKNMNRGWPIKFADELCYTRAD